MEQNIFNEVENKLKEEGLTIVSRDTSRPWGGFFVIDDNQAEKFIQIYFPDHSVDNVSITSKISPKILMVAPQKRLSWQYHHRRAELWRVVEGPIGVAKSDNDEQNDPETYNAGDTIVLQKGERHRLIGLEKYGVVAEIWQHTDASNPSDEEDIIRLQDDFGR